MTGAAATPLAALPALFEAQRAARPRVAATGPAQRRAKLLALHDALLARRAEAHAALAADFGKAPEEVDLTELYPTLKELRVALRDLDAWMKPRRVRTPLAYLGSSGRVAPQPKGVALILSPWNYPLFLTLGPLVSAMAAGCCVMLRASEHTAHATAFMARLLADLYPADEVAMVVGGVDAAEALLDLPFDHVFFTGGPAVGRRVMAAAARHLASVTLELGGKSPVLVDADADLARAAGRIAWGKFINAGQTCVAPDYVLAHEAIHGRLLEALERAVRRSYGETPEARRASPDFARIINGRHVERLRGLLDSCGGRIVLGGETDEASRYLAPTLVDGPDPASPLMQEEIFGPILPVLKVRDMEEAIGFVNARPQPLALYAFGGRAREAVARTRSGGACIEDTVLHFPHPELPAGGIGPSGFGKAHGHHGFLAFSNERAVLTQHTPVTAAGLLRPPYTAWKRRLLDFTLRWL